ncbi:hypothetical protein EDE12_101445 [Methylosinus sp. sav-2]|jgi:hypothetical protein|uniref:hypothetical protein n=1 Tax=unclassified Methylosinus TaxID=2624500 RepID=UPI0004636752|nr:MULTISPECIES: hypothetical protein [unclassified Methylosinus]TDX66907.1 hypothetical protein EDE12_101445 [Methylosinus sp. sav-2]
MKLLILHTSRLLLASTMLVAGAGCAAAQTAAPPAQQKGRSAKPAAPAPSSTPAEEEKPAAGATLRLSAVLTQSDSAALRSGLVWRIFEDAAQPDGSRKLVAESREASFSEQLPDGAYIVHVAFGLAGATRRVVMEGRNVSERLALNAGGLKLIDTLGDNQLPAQRLAISIYVPERGNSEAKLVLANARSGEVLCLPEGAYHIVSTLLDVSQGSQGDNNTTNSVVTADLRVPAGKVTEATLRHHAATMTLKLVKAPGGEALANTSFSVLTPGGDVIRELIGAFPSLVLAEGEYVAIARREGKTFQTTFKVTSTQDRDVEILTQ